MMDTVSPPLLLTFRPRQGVYFHPGHVPSSDVAVLLPRSHLLCMFSLQRTYSVANTLLIHLPIGRAEELAAAAGCDRGVSVCG